MKCSRKERYDCFYLTKDNTDEFLKWFGRYKPIDTYNNCDDYISICIGFVDNEYSYKFYYDHWQVFKDGSFYEYSNGIFNKMYEIVEDKEM